MKAQFRTYSPTTAFAVSLATAALLGFLLSAAEASNPDNTTVGSGAGADEISVSKQPTQKGAIVEMSSTEVTVGASGKKVSLPVNQIVRVIYNQEPIELSVARRLVAAKQYDMALKKLDEVNLDQIHRDLILQDVAYYKAYSTAKIASSGKGDKESATKNLTAFVTGSKNNYHYFAALEALGDLAVANGQYDAASKSYGEIAKAPWPAYKLRAVLLEGQSLQAQKKYPEALEKYESVIGASSRGVGVDDQKHLANLAKMSVLVATEKYPGKVQVPDPELLLADNSVSYGDDCCWDFTVAQVWGMPGNIMYIDGQVTTQGVTVINVNGPAGTQPPIISSSTSVHWYMPTPNGLWDANGQTITACFANVPAGGATITLTGYDSAGNTAPLEQTSATFASYGECYWIPDLWMKDTMSPDLPEDFGVEPNTVSQYLWISRDIWVRTSPDTIVTGGTNPGPDSTLPADRYYTDEHQHQNPVYVNANTPSYVYVKVRNRGHGTNSSGSDVLHVYWADASTGLPWPGSGVWNEIDCVAGGGIDPCPLPSIGSMKDYVVQLPWVPPNPQQTGTSHYCLIARIETLPSGTFGMTFAEGPSLWQNVMNNNNIVWKNVTVVNGAPKPAGGGKVIVRNPLKDEATLALRFAVPEREMKNNFLLHGDIFVDLGETVMKKWRQGGQRAQGFAVSGPTTIKVTDPAKAELGGLLFSAGEAQTIEVRMQLKEGDKARAGAAFNWDIIEVAPPARDSKPSVIGGERYTFVVPEVR